MVCDFDFSCLTSNRFLYYFLSVFLSMFLGTMYSTYQKGVRPRSWKTRVFLAFSLDSFDFAKSFQYF